MKRWVNAFKIASVYIGTLLGAGFASGQELLTYFAVYDIKGMFGCVLSGMLFGLILFVTLFIIKETECPSFKALTKQLFPNYIGSVIQGSVMLFMLIIFSAMLAGSGALIKESFNGNQGIGIGVMCVLCFVVYLNEIRGIVFVNTLLAPILLLGSVILGVCLWINRSTDALVVISGSATVVYMDHWIVSSIIYVAYNIVTALVVISGLKKYIIDKHTMFWSSFIATCVLCSIGLTLGSILLIHYERVWGMDLPLLAIVALYDKYIMIIYFIVLASAIFTTAIATGYGVIEFLKDNIMLNKNTQYNKVIISVIVIGLGISFSSIGFGNLVKHIYPVFGYIGLFEIIVILLYYIKIRNK